VEGEIESNTEVTVFEEKTGIDLNSLPSPGPDVMGTLPSGSFTLNSYYFSFDTVNDDMSTYSGGTVAFSLQETIVGIYGLNDTINDVEYTDFVAAGTTYPNGVGDNRGLENNGELPTGIDTNVLTLSSLTVGGNNVDQFRVVTAQIPEPSSFVLLGLGLLGIAVFTRRSFQ